jgi:protein involved in temperature-dependent protein secretion
VAAAAAARSLQRTSPALGASTAASVAAVLAPLSWKSSDPAVRLGRATDWVELEDGRAVPVGQRLLVIDDEPVPILELRDLEISAAGDAEG